MIMRITDGNSFDHAFVSMTLRIIRPNSDQNETDSRPPLMLEMGVPKTKSRPEQDHSRERVKGIRVISIRSTQSLRSEPVGKDGEKAISEWANELCTATAGISAAELRQLTFEQRLIVGRFHAYAFGNCSKSESNNRTRGAHVASQIASMGASREFGDFTVAAYIAAARTFHEKAMGKKPWFRPFDIKAVVDLEILDRRGNLTARTSKYQDIHPAQIELIERLREKGLA